MSSASADAGGDHLRQLTPQFMSALLDPHGTLFPLLERIRGDDTLDLQIRDDYINVYYRGTSVLKASASTSGVFAFEFNVNYFKFPGAPHCPVRPKHRISRQSDCDKWLRRIGILKDAMDRFGTSIKPSREREAQQLVVRENNRRIVGRSTDYFICDVEYSHPTHTYRFDVVAVRWPSTPQARKNNANLRLAFIEIKFGDDSLTGSAGLAKHVADTEALASNASNLQLLKDEMKIAFNQKLELGLFSKGLKKIASFSMDKPQLILVLANHDPDSTRLNTVLGNLPSCQSVDLCVARANKFGYGLYESEIMPVEKTPGATS